MRIRRRDFIKYCMVSSAALGLKLSVLGRLEEALADGGTSLPKVIWLNGANCTGCTVSLANLFSDQGPKDVGDLLINTIDLVFHPQLMGAAGDLAVEQLNKALEGPYVLAVEGGIPTAFGGHTCTLWTENGYDVTAQEAVTKLSNNAAAILCIGTCASFGGIPAAGSNPTGIVSVSEAIDRNTINIPGCPTHPDWIVWTIANLLAGNVPKLDKQGRPYELFGPESLVIHKNCPRKGQGEAKTFGEQNKCLKELGCKGEKTRSLCPQNKWNSSTNWCIGAGSICLACTEDGFPDRFSPFYKIEYAYPQYDKPDPNPEPDPPSEPDPETVEISRAVWRAEKSLLKVHVQGLPGKQADIYIAATGEYLGSGTIPAGGLLKWKLRKPAVVPCKVLVEVDDVQVFRSVRRRPEDCR